MFGLVPLVNVLDVLDEFSQKFSRSGSRLLVMISPVEGMSI